MELYEQRLLVLLEDEDFKGFRQVILTPKQFKSVSDAIFTKSDDQEGIRKGHEVGTVELNCDTVLPAELFEGMTSMDKTPLTN